MNKQSQEYISKEKLAEIKAELDHLKNVRRSELAQNLEKARALGDLSENAEYHQAREDQAWTEDRIAQIEHILRNAKVIDGKKKSDHVMVGSTVTVKKKGDKADKVLHIVGGEESDVLAGKISYNSPLGKALLDKKSGDTVVMQTAKAEVEYKIVSVA